MYSLYNTFSLSPISSIGFLSRGNNHGRSYWENALKAAFSFIAHLINLYKKSLLT